MTIKRITKKVKSLSSLADKNPYLGCQIYKGTCACEDICIGETIRNVVIQRNEHEDVCKEYEPEKAINREKTLKFLF